MAKGMTVRLKADISELERSLKQLNSAAKLSAKELREIERASKLTNGKEYELKAQKVEVLKQKLETLKLKLTELNEIERKWTESGEIENKGKEYRKLQRDTILTKNEMKKLETQIEEVSKEQLFSQSFINGIEVVDSKIKKLSEALGKLADKTKYASALAAGVLTYATTKSTEFEDAMIGVQKTTDITNEEMKEFSQTIIEMSKAMPSSATEIAKTFEMGGQLGIAKDELKEFSNTIIDLINSTNLLSEEGSADLAKFNNIVKFTAKEGAEGYRRWGSAVTALGNNSATTEKDIVSMAMRIASAGKSAGMTSAQILSIAATLSSLGLEAEAGGSAISKLIVKIQQAVETGENYLDDFARISGMKSKEFQKAFKEDAVSAIDAFIKGLKRQQDAGISVSSTLEGMKIKEIRLTDTIRRLMNSGDLLNKTVEIGNKAWKENTALTNEASKKYSSTSSQIKMMKNRIDENAIAIGNNLTPKLLQLTERGKDVTDWFMKFDKETHGLTTDILLFTAVLTPAILGIKSVVDAINIATPAIKGFFTVIQSNPWILTLTVGIAGLTAIIADFSSKVQEEEKKTNKSFEGIAKGMVSYYEEISKGTSKYSEAIEENVKNDDRYKKSQNEVQTAHTKATEIIKKAQEERRHLTAEESKTLREHLETIRNNKEKELALLEEKKNVYLEITKREIEGFKGTKEELNKTFADRYATILESNKKEEEALRQAKETELSLIVEKYKDRKGIDKQQYDLEYLEAENHYDRMLENLRNNNAKELGEINNAKLNKTQVNSELNKILNGLLTDRMDWSDLERSNQIVNNNMIKTGLMQRVGTEESSKERLAEINKKYISGLNDVEKQEISSYLAQIVNVELYGGKLTDKQKDNVNRILDALDRLPSGTKQVMKNAMTPMLDEMEKKEPSLFKKATSIAEGILTRLRKTFDIHSPSRRTRKIYNEVMMGSFLGLEDYEEKLYSKADNIAKNVVTSFEEMGKSSINFGNIPNVGSIARLPKKVMDSSYINTSNSISNNNSYSITINVQEMNEYNMKKTLDYVNKRLGGRL